MCVLEIKPQSERRVFLRVSATTQVSVRRENPNSSRRKFHALQKHALRAEGAPGSEAGDRLRQTSADVVAVVVHRRETWTRGRMEEEARKLHEEGIKKKLVSPGRGELSTFPNGTKVKATEKPRRV